MGRSEVDDDTPVSPSSSSSSSSQVDGENVFVGGSIVDAIAKATQQQALLVVCVQGNTEDDSRMESETWNDPQFKQIARSCVCVKLLHDSVDAQQFMEYYKVTETPTVYFFGLQRQVLLVSNGLLTAQQFGEKYEVAKAAFDKQMKDFQQNVLQLLMLQQLQQAQNQQQPQQSPPQRQNPTPQQTQPSQAPQKPQQTQQAPQKPQQISSQKSQPQKTPSNNNNTINSNSSKTTASSNNNNNNNNTSSNTKVKESKVVKSVTVSPPTKKPSPATERHSCSLAFRLTNGHVLKAQFSPYDTLSAARDYIDKNRTDGSHKYVLMTTHPKRVYNFDENEKKLVDLDLVPSGTLVLVSVDPNAKPIPHPETAPAQTSQQTHTTSASSSSGEQQSGGLLSNVSNYVWGFFGYGNTQQQQQPQHQQPQRAQSSANANAGNSNSFWEHKYDPKREEAVRAANKSQDSTTPAQTPETSTGMRNRGNRSGKVHQLQDTAEDDDKNSYYNGNSTQFK